MEPTVRIGVDVGGTFTDFVLFDEKSGRVHTGKRLTTPQDPSEAIIEGVKRMLAETGFAPADLHSVVHGTTLVTNTIIERTGASVGLITTEGYRDTLEIGKEIRYDLYDLFIEPAPTLVPRHRRLGVPQRMDPDGNVLLALDEEAVRQAARKLVDEYKVEAIAVSFLHSYRNPAHEKQARAVIAAEFPDLPLTLSGEVAPEIREFERTSTACANAYVQPRMRRYLDKLQTSLAALGFRGHLYIMLSGGGITSVREAREFPIRLIESGPAAGAMASAFFSRLAGLDRVISFDMGGTTAKMCLVENASPNRKHDFEAGRVRRFMKGSGMPLKVSVVDMIEIGAGGGSIARVDDIGLMKVGPRSAGASPGPVCYGLGGTEPTVTDGDLILGYLDPKYFLGGEMALDPDRVKRAIDGKLSQPLRVSQTDAAHGIHRMVNENMAAATRMHLAEKGRDPRRYTLIAFGGAGPVHAWGLAKLLKLSRMVVPLGAGVTSALGFLVAPPATDNVRSYVARLDQIDWAHVRRLYAEMEAEAKELLVEAGARAEAIELHLSADMRHIGQGFEINVPLPKGSLGPEGLAAIRASFFNSYSQHFGRTVETIPIEALSWRLTCVAPGRDIRLDSVRPPSTGTVARRGTRQAYFAGHGYVDCAVYDRYALKPGDRLEGPAVIEERESTCVVGPDSTVTVDPVYNLIVDIR
ncbi:MAG: hydantoinase/oxoprolinase family protein [Alphaproteobacteria bacterium]|nr:hydantoinase/oxoprolinase family protein [Alphaproteobacteria bacterium]